MRRFSALMAVMAVGVAGLVGCSASGAAGCDRPEGDPSAFAAVEVSGSIEDAPEVEIPTPFRVNSAVFEDVVRGDGAALTTDDQLVAFDVSLFSGTTGEPVIQSAYDGNVTQVNPVSAWTQTFPGMDAALRCATEGSRVVVALAPDDIAPEASAGIGVAAGDSVVAVVDVRKVYLAKADGANQFNSALGLPTVVRAPNGRPGVIVPDATAPSELVVQTLKKGDGAEVTGDVPVRVQYTGVLWDDHTVFDSTWDSQPASINLAAVVPGFADALRGATVGSQILAVIPPDQGYGDQDQSAIPAGSTLVFVIDVLGLDQAAAQ